MLPIMLLNVMTLSKVKRNEDQQKFEQENKNASEEIDESRLKIQSTKSNDEKILKECNEYESENLELTKMIENIKKALIQLEREIGPTVRSSGVRLEETDNIVDYVLDFQRRVVGGCLLQP
ncbi:8256_t:CDS:2 [Diversispora eburnea]|uniref:8256_t:CDS:1 n=1 Tax=Diversispora eburnea TaxID=1213867 RepID=A0A9N9B605_9GLOM|nr:8256_t:CDS:2 [Diversispora eburnea]